MSLQAVIFDLDGTLIDSMGIWEQVDREFLGKRNIPVPADLFTAVEGGNSFIEIALYFKNRFHLPESISEIMQEWTDMVHHHYQQDVKLKPGAADLLAFLKDNRIKIGVGTSNSLLLTEAVLRANGILDDIDAIVAGCQDIRGKPYPDIFLATAEKLGIEAEKCLVVEDVLVGIRAAKTAGMEVIALYDEHCLDAQEEIRFSADHYTRSFPEIHLIISNLLS